MGSRRFDNEHRDFENTDKNCCGSHGGANSLVGLIFGIVSFSIKLAFKIIEVVFQALFGLLDGAVSGSRSAHNVKNMHEKADEVKQEVSYTINDIKHEATTAKKPEDRKDKMNDNVREFKKYDNNKTKEETATTDSKENEHEEHNKDFYVVLFILTIIPAIVALSMGKLLYAGVIGAAGFGLMLMAGVVAGIAGSFKKKSAEKKAEVDKEEQKTDDSVEKLIKDAFEKLFVIRKDIDKIKDADIRSRIEGVCFTGEKIIGEVRTNPERLTLVRKFFYYYLDAFGDIVKNYVKLSSFEESSEEVGKLVVETEKSFADIDGIFKELCEKLLEKDMMNLKAEINVIKNSN
jgi:5-bromo-4-chloroindolyl phosphate hydrolysis protein